MGIFRPCFIEADVDMVKYYYFMCISLEIQVVLGTRSCDSSDFLYLWVTIFAEIYFFNFSDFRATLVCFSFAFVSYALSSFYVYGIKSVIILG